MNSIRFFHEGGNNYVFEATLPQLDQELLGRGWHIFGNTSFSVRGSRTNDFFIPFFNVEFSGQSGVLRRPVEDISVVNIRIMDMFMPEDQWMDTVVEMGNIHVSFTVRGDRVASGAGQGPGHTWTLVFSPDGRLLNEQFTQYDEIVGHVNSIRVDW